MSQQVAKQKLKHTNQNQTQVKPPSQQEKGQTAVSPPTPFNPIQQTIETATQLQRTIGNQAIGRLLIQPKLTLGPVGDKYEQEADTVAKQVVGHLATSDQSAVQRQEEEELQLKGETAVQRQEDEEMQLMPITAVQRQSNGGGEISTDIEQSIQSARGSGQPLADTVRAPMENAFGTDFSGVNIHTNSQSNTLNQSLQARAFTTGQDVFFRQGEYNPSSSGGQELLAHELTHVVQQGGGVQRQEDEEMQMKPVTAVQRHPVGAELQDKEAQVAEVGEKGKAAPDKTDENGLVAPSATRTKQEEATQQQAGKKAGKAFTESQKLTPGAMSLATAEKILQGAYGGFKKIVPGTIVILANQAACSAKYDEVCMAANILRPDGTPWKAGDCAKDDAAAGVQTEGFAWKGVVYVNGETTLVTATAHEILHNNTEPKFRAKAGETFNEGVTEMLARQALKDAGVKVPNVTAYPIQVKLTKLLIDLIGLKVVEKAYFGDVQDLVRMYLRKGTGTWSQLVNAAEALDADKVKKALKPKTESN